MQFYYSLKFKINKIKIYALHKNTNIVNMLNAVYTLH